MDIEITIKNAEDLINSKSSKSEGNNQNQYSMYARFFDESSPYWSEDPEYNLMFLKQQEAYANEIMKHHGYVFLNKIYEMLGLPLSKAGQIVGWVYDKENPIGDNRIDFGIYDENNAPFINGFKRSILLDFNVDGCILDKI